MILLKNWGKNWRIGCVLALSILQACAIANPKGASFTPDTTVTNTVNPSGKHLEDEQLRADGKVIRDMVTKTSLSSTQSGMEWENDNTGSRGIISSVQPIRDGEKHCRLFTTTREAFDGVMAYEGKACQTPEGGWVLSQFDAR